MKIIKKTLYLIISLICILFVIGVLKKTNYEYFFTFKNLPSLKDIVIYMLKNFKNDKFLSSLVLSLLRVLIGFLISVSLAVPLAFLTYQTKFFRNFIYPVLELLRPVPNAAWIPISILVFTSVVNSVIFIIIMSSFFSIFINTLSGLENIHDNYRKSALSLGVTKRSYIFEILLPAALPSITTGLSLGMSGAWLGLVMAEMISGQSGIGYMIWINYTLVDFSGVIFYMIAIGFFGALSSLCLKIIFKKLLIWKK